MSHTVVVELSSLQYWFVAFALMAIVIQLGCIASALRRKP